MMDLQFWIYVIVGIILAIRSLTKKADNQPQDLPSPKPDRKVTYDPKPPLDKPKPLTFEELLKEITEAKQTPASAPVTPLPKRAEPVLDYDEFVEVEEKSLETIREEYRKDEKAYSLYEEGKKVAFERPSLESTLKLSDTNMEFGKFKVFEQQKQRNLIEEYALNFQDRAGLKRAVVMSEILNRKF